jgi:hypothetical protein
MFHAVFFFIFKDVPNTLTNSYYNCRSSYHVAYLKTITKSELQTAMARSELAAQQSKKRYTVAWSRAVSGLKSIRDTEACNLVTATTDTGVHGSSVTSLL